MKLGYDVFSLRFNPWDAFQHLDYAKRIGFEVVHFSEMEPFASLEPEYLRRVRARAGELGIAIEVGMGSICPTSTTFSPSGGRAADQLSRMLDVAAALGSPALRCYLGSNADRRTELPMRAHYTAVIETCRAVRKQALDLGVKIAIENHAGDMQGRELRLLIEEAGPDFVGACIDSGNPLWVVESPFVTLEHLAPHILMSHIRDTALWPHPEGAVAQWVPMGDGTIDMHAWARRYQELCPHTNFTLEIISTLAPNVLPYLKPEFWDVYPDTPAVEFSRFLRHVAEGVPYTQPLLTADWSTMGDTVRAALAVEQQRQLEKSYAYCRNVLGI